MKKQICFKINIGSNSLINICLYTFLALSLWVILSVGINWLPMFNVSFCEKTTKDLNSVLLNLSYSYFAGFIIYLFTVIIPEINQRSKYIPLINSQIDEYSSGALFAFLLFYYNQADIVDIRQNEYIKEYYEKELKTKHKLINGIASKTDENSLPELLRNLKRDYRNFNNYIIPYEIYLSDNQKSIINAIRIDGFTQYIEMDNDLIGILDMDKTLYNRFNDYIKLIVKLRESISSNIDNYCHVS